MINNQVKSHVRVALGSCRKIDNWFTLQFSSQGKLAVKSFNGLYSMRSWVRETGVQPLQVYSPIGEALGALCALG